MKVVGFLKIMAVVTCMAVIYIHLQVKIYALAYEGKTRQQKIEKLAENNALFRNDILRLRSSDHIGRQLLAKESDYRFAGRGQVVEAEERERSGKDQLAANKGDNILGRVMTLAFTPAAPDFKP